MRFVFLSRLIPGAHVVKAFNTLSAWALQNGPADANRQVRKSSFILVCFRFKNYFFQDNNPTRKKINL